MEQPTTPEQDAALLRRYAFRWALVFLVLICAMSFALWWSSQALGFGTSRIDSTARATYKLRGVVVEKSTGKPVAWADVEDDPNMRPPRFRTSADHQGRFELMTLAETHRVVVSALGYKTNVVVTGKDWYLWMPKGEERIRIELEPE